jgi:transcription initiation factor TFIID subunit 3
MTASELHNGMLRPAVLQILRAAGLSYARPAVVDTVTNLAARYLLLLASSTAQNAFNNHNTFVPTIQDVRLALMEAGALMPQMSTVEESLRGEVEFDGVMVPFEDLRGVEAFVNWAQGPVNKEIRRIAGFGDDTNLEEIAAGLDDQEDYLTSKSFACAGMMMTDLPAVLKKKHSKTGEESRYQGTALGKELDAQPIHIVGGPAGSITDWRRQSMSPARSSSQPVEGATPATSGISSAPLTPIESE